MEYSFKDRTPEQRGENWFGHQISLFVERTRETELQDFLGEAFGVKGRKWRLHKPPLYSFYENPETIVRFTSKQDAIRFKLSWNEDAKIDYAEKMRTWMGKLTLNSHFGKVMTGSQRRGAMSANAPTWTLPLISQTTPGIFPTMHQIKGRSLNPCKEIIMLDYESTGDPLAWYDQWVENMEVSSWSQYVMMLDSEIRRENQFKQASLEIKSDEEAPLQAGLSIPSDA